MVLGEQPIPVGTPDHLDHVPAGAAEDRFQFLDDLTVAADRAVEPLQVAVDDPGEVVELLARGERNRAERFRLVRLAVSQVGPHPAAVGVLDAAIVHVAVEAGLVDRHDRGQAHRDGRIFPEVRHQPGMRVARQPLAARQFAAEVFQVRLFQPPFHEGPRIRTGRGVPLKIDAVARVIVAGAFEEMVETDFQQRGAGGEGGDMPADPFEVLVRPHDHRHGVPANDAFDAALDLAIARIGRLFVEGNRIDVRRVGGEGEIDPFAMCPLVEHAKQILDPLGAFALQHVVERFEPFGRFGRIDVRPVWYYFQFSHLVETPGGGVASVVIGDWGAGVCERIRSRDALGICFESLFGSPRANQRPERAQTHFRGVRPEPRHGTREG